jgi:energy-coupling factor transport system substrate-specific component
MAKYMSLPTQNKPHSRLHRIRNQTFEMVLFSMFAALMFCSKLIMEAFPNIHLLGMLVMLLTVVFRKKALIPIYLYVIVQGLYAGFAPWWVPYLYVWTILWGMTMLLPKKMPMGVRMVVYPIVCSLHGFAFGILYAPAQALMYSFTFEQTLVWISTGLMFDVIHGISNIFTGMLVLPLSELIKKMLRQFGRN